MSASEASEPGREEAQRSLDERSRGAARKMTVSRSRLFFWSSTLTVTIAVVVGIYVPLCGCIGDSHTGKTKADVRTLEVQVIRFKTHHGMMPASLDDLVRRPESLPVESAWLQLMKPSALLDSWGEPYQFRNPGVKNPNAYDIFSWGRDKTAGTEDDIGNWE